ncbi:MAG: nickel-dependent hydrogenase large subunit [Clostridia bacterium]|nr:nickel-dependent hydrogenase large subunit [Clostridia bacterium]MDQ7792395.1 nickel-dependent hydrogenase large subunit [Clostridia bacterium]
MARVTFPFGPQHPVLPEAIQLQLTCEDERVVEVLPVIGYMHRGIEKAAEANLYPNNIFLCERICGICSFIHALCYCELIEGMMRVEVPPRAKYLRVVWSELSRIHSHMLWLGLLADSFGFESLFMQCWRAREIILDTLEMTTGQRVIQSSCVIGGVRRDIDLDMEPGVRRQMAAFQKELKSIYPVFAKDYTVKLRTVGKGVLPRDQAWSLGTVGPTLRGSGWAYDARTLGYAVYDDLGFEPVVEIGCDSYARMMVRLREVVQSVELVIKALDQMPEGDLTVTVKSFPEGEGLIRVEQPRGELVEYARGNGTAYLERLKVRTPTFSNIPALLVMLPGCELADVPVITMSIDPCIACTER